MNLLHDIPSGEENEINAIIEIPKGSKNKYEIDKDTGIISLDRTSHTTQDFPFDYGFIPQTWWDDGDALDVIVLTNFPILPGVLVKVRPVGVMRMEDSGESDDKIISVPIGDPRWESIKDLNDLNSHTLKEMEHFYSTYKKLQNKEVRVLGFDPREKAIEAFLRGRRLYQQKNKQG